MNNEFRCDRCGYSTKYKHSLRSHLLKQKECECKGKEISRDKLLEKLDNILKEYKCENCELTFRDSWVLDRHKSICKVIALGELKTELKELREYKAKTIREKETKTIINNINSNNTTINNNINITMNYCNDKDFLQSEIIRDIIESDDEMSSQMFKALNYDVKHPENHNIIILSLDKEDKCLVYSNGKYIEILVKNAIYQKMEHHKEILLNRTIRHKDRQSIIYHYDGIREIWSENERNDGVYKMIKAGYEKKNIINNKPEIKAILENSK
jgi:hypothetical protein